MQPVEQSQRSRRVRFKHPVRVSTIDGEPRAWRTLAANLSRDGLFVRMPQPLDPGTRVAISLEASGQALPLAEGEVRWCRYSPSDFEGRYQGCGVRFTDFLHPRAPELVRYLVENLDTGRPLKAAPVPRRRWPWAVAAGVALTVVFLAVVFAGQWSSPPVLPEPTDARGPLGVLEVGKRANEELAALVSPAEEELAEGDAAPADSAGAEAAPIGVAAVAGSAGETEAPSPTALDRADVDPAPEVAGAPAPPAEVAAASGTNPTAEVARAPLEPAAGARGPTQGSGANVTAEVARAPLEPAGGARGPTGASGNNVTAEVVRPAEPVGGAGGAQVASASATAREPGVDRNPKAPADVAASGSAPAGPTAAGGTQTAKTNAASKKPAAEQGRVALKTGAASAVSWAASPDGLEVRPALRADAKVARVFSLDEPPRLVFDIDGAAPAKSQTVPATSPLITRVRLGKQGTRTRVVIDLASTPRRVMPAGDHAVVQF